VSRGVALGMALICLAGARPAPAQDGYPNHAIRVIGGFGPGSTADIIGRVLAPPVGKSLGQQIIVEARPGAGSSIAAEYVARAETDGYTLFIATTANSINAAISKLPFNLQRDLAPIALIGTVPNILAVHPSTGVSNVRELIALAKSSREPLLYGSSGVGTVSHLAGELFNQMAGVKMVHVSYAGSAQVMSDFLAGRVNLVFSPASAVLQHAADGKIRALASTEAKRTAAAPDLPTVAESGLPGYETGLWFGLLAPAGTPRPIVDKLSAAVNEALKSEEVIAPLRKQGIDVVGGDPDAFAAYIDRESRKWLSVAETAGLKK